jgi:hypothetical protein
MIEFVEGDLFRLWGGRADYARGRPPAWPALRDYLAHYPEVTRPCPPSNAATVGLMGRGSNQ